MRVVYMCRPEFENGGLRSGPSLKMGGFQSGPSLKNEGNFGTKNNRETYIFKRGVFWSSPGRISGRHKCICLKRGSFGAIQVEKVESLGAAHAEKWGLLGGTYPYCPNIGVPLGSRDALSNT